MVITHIDDLTESLRVVSPTGISESRRLPASGAGPSPDRLFLGSEGALGVITEAWMRLQERPRWQQSVTVDFTTFAEAVAATRAIAQSGLHPSNCRLLDPMEALINAGTTTSGGLLVLAFESADHPVGPWLDRAIEIARDHGGRPGQVSLKGPDRGAGGAATPADTWRASFLRMPYQRDAVAQRSIIAETFETACTWDRFEELHAAITAAAYDVMAEVGAPGALTCRFTHVYPDGPAPYYGVYAAGAPSSRCGTRSSPVSRRRSRRTVGRSHTTTRWAGTTSSGTSDSGQSPSPTPCERPRALWTRTASSTPESSASERDRRPRSRGLAVT